MSSGELVRYTDADLELSRNITPPFYYVSVAGDLVGRVVMMEESQVLPLTALNIPMIPTRTADNIRKVVNNTEPENWQRSIDEVLAWFNILTMYPELSDDKNHWAIMMELMHKMALKPTPISRLRPGIGNTIRNIVKGNPTFLLAVQRADSERVGGIVISPYKPTMEDIIGRGDTPTVFRNLQKALKEELNLRIFPYPKTHLWDDVRLTIR